MPLSPSSRVRMREMLSTPPATMAETPSETMRPAAIEMAFRPEAQKRLMVAPVMPMGRPARSTVCRATLRPVVPSG